MSHTAVFKANPRYFDLNVQKLIFFKKIFLVLRVANKHLIYSLNFNRNPRVIKIKGFSVTSKWTLIAQFQSCRSQNMSTKSKFFYFFLKISFL